MQARSQLMSCGPGGASYISGPIRVLSVDGGLRMMLGVTERDRGDTGWSVEYYETAAGEQIGSAWLQDLDEAEFAAWLAFVEVLLIPYGKDIPYRNWVKALGDGLFELRIDQPEHSLRSIFASAERSEATPSSAILLRAFCTFVGRRVVIVLGGYDKGADPSKKQQQRAINRARKILKSLQSEQRRLKRRCRRS